VAPEAAGAVGDPVVDSLSPPASASYCPAPEDPEGETGTPSGSGAPDREPERAGTPRIRREDR